MPSTKRQRHLWQLLQHPLPDGFQDGKGGLVGLGQGQGIQGGPEQEAHERHNTPYQVCLLYTSLLLPAGQRVGVALPIGSQSQFLQSRGGQGQVRIADAERALRLHTLGK